MKNTPQFVVAALYKFVKWPDFADHQIRLQTLCRHNGVTGSLLLASEGINGTIAGPRKSIDLIIDTIRELPGFEGLAPKESYTNDQPFRRMKVKLKREIVTMGVEGIDPNNIVGTYIKPEDWNDLISDPDTIVVDTRNDYETQIGSFKGALDPNTRTFREFPEWLAKNKDRMEGKKVAMFCTGGIRCEKSTAFAKEAGLTDVFHLEGGILKYLENVPQKESLWEGDCFVFDERVSVRHGLEPGEYNLCRACRRPVSPEEMQHKDFTPGISCHRCIDEYTDEERKRFAERQKQIELAQKRGKRHMGHQI